MKALYCDRGRLELKEDLPRPARGFNDVLIRTSLAGICGTDLELRKGYMGFKGVPGHEFVGVVEECADPAWRGERVVGEINCACGDCPFCRQGLRSHCPSRSVLGILNRGGAFAEFLSLPAANLHPVPASLTDEEAVFVEPLAAACQILDQVEINRKDRVGVLGDGRLGLLVAQVLAGVTSHVVLIGRHAERAGLFEGKPFESLRTEDCEPKSFDVLVECTGSPGGLSLALGLVRPRGTLVLKSTVLERSSLDLSQLVVDEISVVGSRCGPFPKALDRLVSGEIQVTPLIDEIFALGDALRAFDKAARPGTLKVLLRI